MKTFHKVSILLFAGLWLLAAGCEDDNDLPSSKCLDGEGPIVTEVIPLNANVNSVYSYIAADITIKQGSPQEMIIEAQSNIIDNLDIDVSGNTLDISEDRCTDDFKPVKIYLTLASLEKMHLSGVGDVMGASTLDAADELDLRMTGVGDIILDIQAQRVSALLTGVGNIMLTGAATEQEITISGVGDYHGYNLASEHCSVTITGQGDAQVNVSKTLDVTITGVGSVYYLGDPELDVKITGVGKVVDAN